MIGLGDGAPQVKALQALIPRIVGANATEEQAQIPMIVGASVAKEQAHPQVTPRTTRTKKPDIGNQGENTATRKTKTCLVPGAAKKLMRSLGASAIFRTIRESACLLMSKHMMGQVILMIT
jgi:hypothetical protein